jgi:hypothetical protein
MIFPGCGPMCFYRYAALVHQAPFSSGLTSGKRRHVEVGDGGLAIDEVLVVFRVVLRDLNVLAGERLDVLDAVPPAERDQLGTAITEVAGEQLSTLIAGRLPILRHAGPLHDVDVLIDTFGADPAAPHAYDHAARLSRAHRIGSGQSARRSIRDPSDIPDHAIRRSTRRTETRSSSNQ